MKTDNIEMAIKRMMDRNGIERSEAIVLLQNSCSAAGRYDLVKALAAAEEKTTIH